jgi:hypothetical protein
MSLVTSTLTFETVLSNKEIIMLLSYRVPTVGSKWWLTERTLMNINPVADVRAILRGQQPFTFKGISQLDGQMFSQKETSSLLVSAARQQTCFYGCSMSLLQKVISRLISQKYSALTEFHRI